MGKRIATELMLVLAIGFALGLIGPFGTYELPTIARLAYWLVFGVAGYAVFRPLVLAGDWLSELLDIPPFVGIGIALLVAALPMTILVGALLFRFDIAAALNWNGIGVLYFQVWLIGFLTNAVFQLLFRKPKGTKPVHHSNAMAARVESVFASRLPAGFGALLALRGEDHYVRAIGEMRDELILIRLRDAMVEVSAVEGMAVHRCWWVARAAVKSVKRDGRAISLILANGCEVPVARDNAPLLRRAGWLD